MLIKKREKPPELLRFEALRGRMAFSAGQQREYLNLSLGYAGECLHDQIAESMASHVIQLNDLLLESGGRTCQIDTLFICAGKVFILEIKNWQGSFEIMDDTFAELSACPLAQLKRSKQIVTHLLQGMGVRAEIEERLIFMNPNMTVYGLERNMPLLFAHQLPEYYQNVCRLGRWTAADKHLAEKLLQQHMSVNRFTKEVAYSHTTVTNGVMCPACREKMQAFNLVALCCAQCGQRVRKKVCLIQAKAELDILFAESEYPLHDLYEWCDGLISKRTIFDFFRHRS